MYLVGVNLVALGQIGHRRLFPQRLQGHTLAFSAASIFRLVLGVIVRSV